MQQQPSSPLARAVANLGMERGTTAHQLHEMYDSPHSPLHPPAFPDVIHLHYIKSAGRPRWVVALHSSYICHTPQRCRIVRLCEPGD